MESLLRQLPDETLRDLDPQSLASLWERQASQLSQETSRLRRMGLDFEQMRRLRDAHSGLEATRTALEVLTEDPATLRTRLRERGALSGALGRLMAQRRRDPPAAARTVYRKLWPACDRCDNLGFGDPPRHARCSCIRGSLLPAHRCPRCEDTGLVETGSSLVRRCSCRESARAAIGPSTPLINVSLLTAIPQEPRARAQRLLDSTEEQLCEGVALWISGGQRWPRPGLSETDYSGVGVAWLCAAAAERQGARVRELDPLELLALDREGDELIREGEMVHIRTLESAVPTPRLRRALERLLDEAYAACSSVLISSRLPNDAASVGALTTWATFAERVADRCGADTFSELRAALAADPGDLLLGELHTLMLRPLCAADYLSARAQARLAWMTPRAQAAAASAAQAA